MTPDQYLRQILTQQAVDTSNTSPIRTVQAVLTPIIQQWAGDKLLGITPSGSFAKGTANRSGTDIDLFISLSPQTSETLKEIYDKLFNWMQQKGYAPKRQNVSINVRMLGYDVDLVPAKRHDNSSNDHSLYRRRAGTWTKTDVGQHIRHVLLSGRSDEIRILKRWRDQKALDFPSFYLELTVIAALSGAAGVQLATNVWKCLEYLRDKFSTARVVDPANSNNVVSDDLTAVEKAKIKAAATQAIEATRWDQIVL
jgi:hypothetical protein